eukprot:CAMPEP_0115862040 /NCGR_PEP_ID=MMETSP0287-20121206/17970_1 /TAXON_ID=412157 /ORGANISM="Chrysochromulina rotalis, Strain UIO044" /LENGTH=319 /DNA_ID=CAMNT_0003316447 /DNA_START=102 /DNA_END=1063 /DNA_ORIENTATION=+
MAWANCESLGGTIPTELGLHAPSLQLMEARMNALSGSLPDELGQMQVLQAMMLQNNSFSGTLPADFGRPQSGAAGTGLIGGLPTLRYLELQHNSGLSGTLPTSLGVVGHDFSFVLPELRDNLLRLIIQGTQLSGSLPSELGQLNELNELNLEANAFSGSIPSEIGRLRKLEVLDLYSNALEGDLPSSVAHLINIRLFYLPNEVLTPLRMHYCGQRMPNVGKYSYRIVREEYTRMSSALCAEPLDTLGAFGTLSQLSGDVYCGCAPTDGAMSGLVSMETIREASRLTYETSERLSNSSEGKEQMPPGSVVVQGGSGHMPT